MELVDRSRVNIPAVRNETRGEAAHLGEALRAARLARNLTLDVVQARTKLKREFFEDLERNDLSKWPSNAFYRESYLRAYATAIGLDPTEIVRQYRHEYEAAEIAEAADAAVARPRRRLTAATIPLIIAATFVLSYAAGLWLTPPAAPPTETVATQAPAVVGTSGVDPRQSDVVLPAETVEREDIEFGEIEGELLITSTPSGAHVTVNGIGRGSTPLRVRFLPAGTYTVRFVRAGHPSVTRHVTISPERQHARVSAGFGRVRATN